MHVKQQLQAAQWQRAQTGIPKSSQAVALWPIQPHPTCDIVHTPLRARSRWPLPENPRRRSPSVRRRARVAVGFKHQTKVES